MKTLCLLFAILFAFHTGKTVAQEFTAQGEVSYTVYNAKNEIWDQVHKRFLIERNGVKWLIRTRDLNANESPNSIDLYQEAGCDSTNIFWVTVQDTNKISKGVFTSVLGTVTGGIVPIFDENVTLISPIWLAYASLPYFKDVRDGKVKHVEHVSDEIFEKETVQAEWQISSNASEFIQSATYHDNGMTIEHMLNGETKTVPWPKPFDQGFISAQFTTGGYTNIGSLSIPTEFTLSINEPRYRPTNGLRVVVSIQGNLTSFSSNIDNQTIYPTIIGKALVSDKRFPQMKNFNYELERGEQWLQVGDPKLKKIMNYYDRNYAQEFSKPPPNPTAKRLVVILLIASNLVLFGFILWRLKSSKSHHPNN